MPNDKSSQRLLRHALCTCGTNDSVVSVPAANPNNVIQGVIYCLPFAITVSPYPATFPDVPAESTPAISPAWFPDSAPPAPTVRFPGAQILHPPRGPEQPAGRPSIFPRSAGNTASAECPVATTSPLPATPPACRNLRAAR